LNYASEKDNAVDIGEKNFQSTDFDFVYSRLFLESFFKSSRGHKWSLCNCHWHFATLGDQPTA